MSARLFFALLAAALVTALLVTCGLLVYRRMFSNEELASKPEWSIVQAIACRDRDKPGDTIEVVKMGEYSVVGIPVHDSRKEIWIMLNPRNPPYYKQLPAGRYALTKGDLEEILASGVVSSTVKNCLLSHVEGPK